MLTKYFHQLSSEKNAFYSYFNKDNTVLYHALNDIMVYYNRQIQRLFVPKFYHERKSKNFLKTLKFIREWYKIDKIGFSEFPNEFSRKLYEYQKDPNCDITISLKTSDVDWPMPDSYFKSIGPTLGGFSFLFPNSNKILSDNLAPINELVNLESGTEEIYNVLSLEIFFPQEKEIREKITEYNATPIKNFINESYFLYDKSNFIEETFVTAINKKLSIYGLFIHF